MGFLLPRLKGLWLALGGAVAAAGVILVTWLSGKRTERTKNELRESEAFKKTTKDLSDVKAAPDADTARKRLRNRNRKP